MDHKTQAAAERRQREDAAPRLKERAPRRATLRFELHELRGERRLRETVHVWHIIVDRAPALFDFPCSEEFCRDGGYDIAYEVMRALEVGVSDFEGEDRCVGATGTAVCERVLHFVALATYRD